MTDWILADAKLLREGPLYADPASGVLTCRSCKEKFKRKRSLVSPCCADCTLRIAKRLAGQIIDDAALRAIEVEPAVPVLDARPAIPGWTSGKRYIPLVPIVNTDSWQIARGLGKGSEIIELIFADPVDAQKHADKFMRGKGPGRVLEIELVDAAHTTATPEQKYERAERLMFKYTEEEKRLRPVLRGEQAGETTFQERDVVTLANQALAGPHLVLTGPASTYRCRRCERDSIGAVTFCAACVGKALGDLAAFVVKHAPQERIPT